MSIFQPHVINPEGKLQMTVSLAECVNVRRTPKLREQILAGDFHQIKAPESGHKTTVEKQFMYVDFDRNTFILVRPRNERHLWKIGVSQLEQMLHGLPDDLRGAERPFQRVVYGLDELREKLLAQDAGIDDNKIELLKVMLISDQPVLLNKPRLRLLLKGITPQAFEFIATYDHNPRRFQISLPRAVADVVVRAKEYSDDPFAAADKNWVNFWKLNPSNEALSLLKTFSDRVRHEQNIDTRGKDFKFMLRYLPTGDHLPGWGKKALRDLFVWVKGKPELAGLQKELFQIRFQKKLEDDWFRNDDPEDVDTIWKVFAALPDSNVLGNSELKEISFDKKGASNFDTATDEITIGSKDLSDHERFEFVLRHEVGHAVHELYDSLVTPWLTREFGWREFPATPKGIDDWVELMGGYGNVTLSQKRDIRRHLKHGLGPGEQFQPGPAPVAPAKHPWNRKGFAPRLAYENSGALWYKNNENWHRYKGLAFFCNFFYQSFMVVKESTLELVNTGMPRKYAAMSPPEFFADLYSLYYDLDHPFRKKIPDTARKWLEEHIGAGGNGQPARPTLQPGFRGSKAAKSAG